MVSLGIYIVTGLRRRCEKRGVAGEPEPPLLRRCHFPPPHPRLAFMPL